MSKPAAYTVQLQKKANGVLQARLMVPGYDAIMLHPKELREVAAGIEAMFGQVEASRPAQSEVARLEKCVVSMQAVVSEALTRVQDLLVGNFALAERIRALEKSAPAQHLACCASSASADGYGCQASKSLGDGNPRAEGDSHIESIKSVFLGR